MAWPLPRPAVTLLGIVVLVSTACGQFDEVGLVDIRNDTAKPVGIYMCGDTCRQKHDYVVADPGGRGPFNGTVGGPGETFLITSEGKQVGCLTILIKSGHRFAARNVTEARPCSKSELAKPSLLGRFFG